MQKLGIGLVILMLTLVACQSTNSATGSDYTGFIQGTQVEIAAQVGGHITDVDVQEGDTVQAGQKIATIEDDVMQAQIAAADANVAAAQAQLALLQAGARSEEIQRAQARAAQAQAALDAATQALADVQSVRANPQALVIGQAQADARAKVAAQQLVAAQNQAWAADEMNKFWEDQTRSLWDGVDIKLPRGGTLHFDTPLSRQLYVQQQWQQAGNAAWQAWAGVAQAQANADTATANLKDISEQLANPIALDAHVNDARAAKEQAAAALQQAQAALQILRDGASPAQIQAARAAVDEARAARATLDQTLGHYEITAPQAGTIANVYYRVGETALPGVALAELQAPDDLTLRVYVPMSVLDRIQVGQSISVRVDGLESQTFTGTLSRIGDQAEFTGRQAQTDSERNAQLVAVEIALRDNQGQLKAGMPASVSFK